jgi:hypothetical protein
MPEPTNAVNATAAGGGPAGEDVTVTISDMRQVGIINFDPMMEFDVTVVADGQPAYAATFRQMINQMQLVQLRSGTSLPGRVSPDNPAAVWLDFSGGV